MRNVARQDGSASKTIGYFWTDPKPDDPADKPPVSDDEFDQTPTEKEHEKDDDNNHDHDSDSDRDDDGDRPPKTDTPQLPDDTNDLLDDVRKLIDLARDGGKSDTADKLEALLKEGATLLVSLGILVGGYYLATRYVQGRLLLMWGYNARGRLFRRKLARAQPLLHELEALYREVIQIVESELPGAGAGGDWKVLDELIDPSVPRQIDSLACGPACVQMLLEDRGIEVSQTKLAELARVHPEIKKTNVEELACVLNKLDPSATWEGGGVSAATLGDRQIIGILNKFGPWVAQLSGHFVVVDGMDDGFLLLRDPWDGAGAGNGTRYKMAIDEFLDYWTRLVVRRT